MRDLLKSKNELTHTRKRSQGTSFKESMAMLMRVTQTHKIHRTPDSKTENEEFSLLRISSLSIDARTGEMDNQGRHNFSVKQLHIVLEKN